MKTLPATPRRRSFCAAGAEAIVLELQVKTAVEIQRRAVLIQLGPDATVVANKKIDLVQLLGARQERTLNRGGRKAFGSLVLLPLEPRHWRTRLDGNPQDHAFLDDQPGDRLADDPRLRGEQAEQQGNEIEDRPRDHPQPAAIPTGFAAKR